MGRTQVDMGHARGLRDWFRALGSLLARCKTRGDPHPGPDYPDGATDIEAVVTAFQNLVSKVTRDGNELSELYLQAERRAAGGALLNETIVESVTSGIMVIERGCTLRLVNSSARRLLKVDNRLDLVGKKLGKLFLDGAEIEQLVEEDMREGRDSSRRIVPVILLDGRKRKLGMSTSCVRPAPDSEAHAIIVVFTVLDEGAGSEPVPANAEAERQGYLRGVLDSYDLTSGLLRGFDRIEAKSRGGTLTKTELAEFSACLRRTCDIMMAFALSLEASSSLTELVDVNGVIESVLKRRAPSGSSKVKTDLCPDLPQVKTIRKVLETGLELLIAGCISESASGIGLATCMVPQSETEVVSIFIRELSETKPLLELGYSLRELAGGDDLRREAGLLLLASLSPESHQVEAGKVDGLFNFSIKVHAPIDRKAGKSQRKGDTIERKE